jgi:hypothetical protein
MRQAAPRARPCGTTRVPRLLTRAAAAAAVAQVAQEVGLSHASLSLPLLVRAAYGPTPPKLVVMLREPGARLHSAFWRTNEYQEQWVARRPWAGFPRGGGGMYGGVSPGGGGGGGGSGGQVLLTENKPGGGGGPPPARPPPPAAGRPPARPGEQLLLTVNRPPARPPQH